ncbi:YheC/D-like protein [Paenibacillus cellulosilyticus]|uniref:YheC/D-like protein n=1 Tax=Paenibacillus cellulosilyticus TaxID=375489 RepID=A0A2V2YMI3_9BACL|nr:YheC/YheD family protein [Paenibacillus cellulosilyticus]PWV95551.1 YheC/D-like protein [Paenibacillus cellulosilyticus]QKS47370.1 YheC/YheD family protein [Paenibacillus cellulosilyticus]
MTIKNRFVGILVANRTQRKQVLSQYLTHDATGVKLISFTPSSIDWKHRTVVGLHRVKGKWSIDRFPFPEVVYNRCYGSDPQLLERLKAVIGGNHCFNHINQLNKLDIYNKLTRWLAPNLPETLPYEEADVIKMLERHKEIYFKPLFGSMGRGVYRAEMNPSGDVRVGQHYFAPKTVTNDHLFFQEHMKKLVSSTPYIVQKGIPIRQIDGHVFDIRSLVQKNDQGLWSVTNLVSRIAYKGSFNTSIFDKTCLSEEILKKLYPPHKVQDIMTSIYDVSLRTAEIIDLETDYHLGEFSVDVALDNDAHPWIIELNGQPQKSLYRGIPNRSVVYNRPIQYAKYLCEKGS